MAFESSWEEFSIPPASPSDSLSAALTILKMSVV